MNADAAPLIFLLVIAGVIVLSVFYALTEGFQSQRNAIHTFVRRNCDSPLFITISIVIVVWLLIGLGFWLFPKHTVTVTKPGPIETKFVDAGATNRYAIATNSRDNNGGTYLHLGMYSCHSEEEAIGLETKFLATQPQQQTITLYLVLKITEIK